MPALLGLLALAGIAHAEPARPDPPPGHLLIASEAIQDPRFHHTVILLLRHDTSGAFGIVINRPLAEQSIASLLAAAGERNTADAALEGSIRVFAGGPVQQQRGFVVHSAEYRRDETLEVDGVVAMTASKDILRDIGRQRGPKRCFFAFGYAGWGAGQLEGEMARGDWHTAPEEPTLVFDEDRSAVWQRAFARRTREM